MHKLMRPITCALFAVGFVFLSGCGGGGAEMAEVQGTVTMGGKPLDKIMVEFWPVSEGPRSFATTDADGRFKLMTDDGKRDGASVGSHKVVLKDVGVLGDKFLGRAGENADMSQGKKPRISGKYASPETTMISEKVVNKKKNEFTFEVEKF